MTAAFGNSYGYDANGNQTTRTIAGVTYTFTYDYENHLTAVSGGSISASFVYDADGNRVKGTVNGTTTVYIAGLYEYQGGATTLYYEGNVLRRTGYATDNGVFYLLQDQLKSSSVMVNQNGAVNSRNYFYPFGGNRGGAAFSSLTTKRFTGQYHEVGLPGGEGLSYYGARWYDAQLGRFASADSVVPGAGNPQTLNRYAYTLNNPLRYTDSTGHSVDGPGIGAGGTVVTQPYRLYLPPVSNQYVDPVFGGMDYLTTHPIQRYAGPNPYARSGAYEASRAIPAVAQEYSVPPQVIAAILNLENPPETGYMGVARRELKMTWVQVLQIFNPGHDGGKGYSRGIGNVKQGTAREIISYFAQNYPDSGMAQYINTPDIPLWNTLDRPSGNVNFIGAYARMAIDNIYGKGYAGPMSLEGLITVITHHNTGTTDREDWQYTTYDERARALLINASTGSAPLMFYR